eukprot:14101941-Ditylum_brightwellii.AAC.1
MSGFDLHNHHCKHNYRRDTQEVAFASDPDKSCITKGKLYCLNNSSKAEHEKWLHTGHWKFVPFTAKGEIIDVYIANMFRVQNCYLRKTISISMKGFSSLDCHISAPGFSTKMTLHQWLLTIWTKD